jgi:hypothetical protein
MGEWEIGPMPTDDGANQPHTAGPRNRQEWVQANFTQIFGTSAEALWAQGINPRQYARQHRDQIRLFAQLQRSQGIAVPDGRPAGGGRPGTGGPSGGAPTSRGYGSGRGGFGVGMRGGSAWIGVLIALFALRFLLVDSLVGAHAAILWVLMIGGVMLVARVVLFSWLRQRRFNRRQERRQQRGQSGF